MHYPVSYLTTEYGELMVTITTDCRFEGFTEAMLNIVDHGSWQRWGARRLGDNEGTCYAK